jgi:hypothetical protein
MSLEKLQPKGQTTISRSVRTAVGLADDEVTKVSVSGRSIGLAPLVIDRSKFPDADDEYTPSQRRAINRGIAQSEKEYKQGRSFGPFETHEAFVRSLQTEAAKLRGKKAKPAAK